MRGWERSSFSRYHLTRTCIHNKVEHTDSNGDSGWVYTQLPTTAHRDAPAEVGPTHSPRIGFATLVGIHLWPQSVHRPARRDCLKPGTSPPLSPSSFCLLSPSRPSTWRRSTPLPRRRDERDPSMLPNTDGSCVSPLCARRPACRSHTHVVATCTDRRQTVFNSTERQ